MKIGNVKNLKVNNYYKNYTSLCKDIGISKKPKENKQRHIAELSRFCKFNINGDSYEVIEVYEKPLLYEEVEHLFPEFKPLHKTDPYLDIELYCDKNEGIEMFKHNITRLDTKRYWWKMHGGDIYIYSSPKERFDNPYNLEHGNDNSVAYSRASVNAKLIFEYLSARFVKFAPEYSFNDLVGLKGGKLRFDFAIIGENEELLGLIEYDGEYHDEELNPDIENYKVIHEHDERKNTYCKNNNIPLLRIHHSEFENYKEILDIFLISIGQNSVTTFKSKAEKMFEELSDEIKKLESINDSDVQIINLFRSILKERNECLDSNKQFDLSTYYKVYGLNNGFIKINSFIKKK